MDRFTVDFSRRDGRIKPLHSVNNGPSEARCYDNSSFFTEAGIPFARLHDSAFYSLYGGEHTVDVLNIFHNWDADVDDPDAYDFDLTDEYLQSILRTGTQVFYRLGSKIEHESKKYQTKVPKDYLKWARICEHIIRHVNEGWANGHHMNIQYWEIWNEPDCRNKDGSNPCWQGTAEQFNDFFYVVLKHLKTNFPDLKIGGPSFCFPGNRFDGMARLLDHISQGQEKLPLDFFSFHIYSGNPNIFPPTIEGIRKLVTEHGYPEAELILNEWNYVRAWTPGSEVAYSYAQIHGIKGASFIAATQSLCQKTALDHLMYYDARPCVWNGLFECDTNNPYKGSYIMRLFGDLYRMDYCASSSFEGDVYGVAAGGKDEGALMLTRFTESDDTPVGNVDISLSGLPDNCEIKFFLLDTDNDFTPFRTDRVFGGRLETLIPMKVFDTLKITVKSPN